ncbi:MAG: hypothetical protein AAGA92_00290 [Planctomycetota bacterium]
MNPQTTKRLIAVAVFVLLLFVGDRGLSALLSRAEIASGFRYSRMYRGGNDFDVLILGNSRSIHSMHAPTISEKTGKRAFHLGFNGLPMVMSGVWLADYLEHNDPPETVLLEVSSLGTESVDAVRKFSFYQASSSLLAPLLKESSAEDYWATRVSHLYRHNGDAVVRCLYFLGRSDQARAFPSSQVGSEAMLRSPLGADYSGFVIREGDNLPALKRVVQLCRENGIELRLMLAPLSPQAIDTPEVRDAFLERVADETGQPVLDFSEAVTDLSAFRDRVHMNKKGLELFADVLISRGILPASGS